MTHSGTLAVLALMLSACQVEQTPASYIDPQQTPADAIETSRVELRSRLLSMSQGLQRRDLTEVTAALAPHPDLFLFGPDGRELTPPGAGVASVLGAMASDGIDVPRDLEVTVDPGNRAAWFHTEFINPNVPGAEGLFQFSGVFLRYDGEWRLIQGHVSRPFIESPPVPPVEGDTLGAAG